MDQTPASSVKNRLGSNIQPRGWQRLWASILDFSAHDPLTLAASTAFYAAPSFAPIIVLSLWTASQLSPGAEDKLIDQLAMLLGRQVGESVHVVMTNVHGSPFQASSSGAVSVTLLIISASTAFAQLQASINAVWGTAGAPSIAVWAWIRRRILSFGMLAVIGFPLMMTLVVSSVLSLILRQRHGFDLEILDRPALNDRFAVGANAGLLTTTSAECDPMQLTRSLLARVLRRGGQVFERSCLEEFTSSRRGVTATLQNGARIRCKHLVFAAGYESQKFLKQRVARNHSSYALVTDPMPDRIEALSDCLFWESARPYLYVRSTADKRLIIGGEDDTVDIPAKRDASVSAKSRKLLKKASRWFSWLAPNLAYAWAGTFAETEDGLPFFGPHEQHGPRIHFAMAYGGNGITYSTSGAQIIKDSLERRGHPCAQLFSFARLKRK